MEPVLRWKVRWLIPWLAVATALAGASPTAAQERRIMVGESIHVGPDETLGEAMCVACSIRVDGVVTNGVFVVLGTLENRGSIEGDAIVIGGPLESSGSVLGKSVVVGGNLRLLADVGGDAITVLGSLEAMSPDVSIGGNAVTILGRQSGISEDAVGGSIERVAGEQFGRLVVSGALAGLAISAVSVLVALLVLNALAVLILGSDRVQTIAEALDGNLVPCLLCGLGTCLLMLIAALTVAIMLPVSVPLIAVLALVSVVGYSGISYRIGRNLFPNRSRIVGTQLAAAIVIVIQLIPVIGWMVLVAVWGIAIGAAVLSGFGTSPDWLAARAGSRSKIRKLAS